MDNNLLNSVKEQYIKALADEKVSESLVRPLSFVSPNAVRNQSILQAQSDVEQLQNRLIKGLALVEQEKTALST